MNKKEMKELIINLIKKDKWVPLLELEGLFETNNYDYKGNSNLYIPNEDGTPNESLIIWKGWNKETTTMICEILEKSNGKIAYKTAFNPIELLLLGGGPANIPIASSITRKYKDPHWVPGAYVWLGDK